MNGIKALIDSNIIIDALARREDSDDSIECLVKMTKKLFDGYIFSKQLTDIYYVLRKYLKLEDRKQAIKDILKLFNVADLKVEDLKLALTFNGKDYDDDVLLAVAKRENIDYIITKNAKDFEKIDNIKAISPKDFLKIIRD